MTTDTTQQPADDGGPAFPITPPICGDGHPPHGYPYPTPGMSLRDWFAGRETLTDADTAWLDTATRDALAGRPMPAPDGQHAKLLYLAWEADWLAGLRYMRADAMLRARERGR